MPVTSSCAAGLEACLHVPAGFRGNRTAFLEAAVLFPCPDDFQVDGSGVAGFVQDAKVAEKVDVPAPVGLVAGRAGALLAALAVPDMDVPDTVGDAAQCFHRVLARPVYMAGVHIETEGG
jgi:hypothetical protein